MRSPKPRLHRFFNRLEAEITLLESSPRRDWVDRALPWLVFTLAIVAFAAGIHAVIGSEYCYRGRSSSSCVTGVTAQLQGAATVAVAGALALIPFRWSVRSVIAMTTLSTIAFGLLIASLLFR